MRLLVEHTREGMFCDPAHGGNRDLVGWKLLGYPGVHRDWTSRRAGRSGRRSGLRPLTTMADDRFGIDAAVTRSEEPGMSGPRRISRPDVCIIGLGAAGGVAAHVLTEARDSTSSGWRRVRIGRRTIFRPMS